MQRRRLLSGNAQERKVSSAIPGPSCNGIMNIFSSNKFSISPELVEDLLNLDPGTLSKRLICHIKALSQMVQLWCSTRRLSDENR